MSRLDKKLDELSGLLKQFNASIKVPKPPGIKKPSIPKAPGVAPKSQKDPVKMAEQIANPDIKPMIMDQAKTMKESLRISKSGQWSISKADSSTSTSTVRLTPEDHNKHDIINRVAPSATHHGQDQNNILEGLEYSQDRPVGEGVTNAHWMKNKHGDDLIVKDALNHPDYRERGHGNLNSAHREVMYHNLARDFFDMGKHVPTTSMFDKEMSQHSAQKKVPGEHLRIEDGKIANPKHIDVLKKLHNSGDLHKITLMDHIMGHHDRHKKNFLIDSDKGDMHLIDNGTSFDYSNIDPNTIPSFMNKGEKGNMAIKDLGGIQVDDKTKLHDEAKKWIMSLDPKKARGIFADHSYSQASDHVSGFIKRLTDLQEKVKSNKYKDLLSLLNENRGKMYDHKKKKVAA